MCGRWNLREMEFTDARMTGNVCQAIAVASGPKMSPQGGEIQRLCQIIRSFHHHNLLSSSSPLLFYSHITASNTTTSPIELNPHPPPRRTTIPCCYLSAELHPGTIKFPCDPEDETLLSNALLINFPPICHFTPSRSACRPPEPFQRTFNLKWPSTTLPKVAM